MNQNFIEAVIILAIAAVLMGAGLYFEFKEEPQTSSTSTFEERCSFYKKITGGDAVIQEHSSGSYHYEVYTEGESIVVYKCKK